MCFASHEAISHSQLSSTQSSNNIANTKEVILSFDDNLKGDFIYAKPILDKYGFKATFFIICNKTGISGTARFLNRTNWQDISAMQKDGMDIESHTMNHRHLDHLSANVLKLEIGGSKQ